MTASPSAHAHAVAEQRLAEIDRARRTVMQGDAAVAAAPDAAGEPWQRDRDWIRQSWQRCLDHGLRPADPVAFDVVSAAAQRRIADENAALVRAARPVLDRLCRAIAHSRYFAVLTNAQGVVIDAQGAIDRSDRRASLVTRIGADLSERSIGTSAIGAALRERVPVWLHRGEHFFDVTSAYSCAGAPLFGPDGQCIGMLDLTGIEAHERPELKHLAAQSARSIENALVLAQPHALQLRLTWPGLRPGDEGDGLIGVDPNGFIGGTNRAAREMVGELAQRLEGPVHCSDLFAMPWEHLFDAVRLGQPIEVPLWSGLRLMVLPQRQDGAHADPAPAPAAARLPLRDLQTEMIRQAVLDAKGNVMEAARKLGISRATVYRRLGSKPASAPR